MKRLIIAILLIIIPAISSAALPIGEIQSAFIRAHPNHYIWLIELSQILPMRKLQKPVNPGKYADSTQKLTYSWEKMICHQKKALRQIEWVGFTMQRSSCVPNRS
ncbi:hypothetical protein A6M27_12085 [Acidithiobacillus thiooxidans]|uniref:Uncharacterized protein n=2 Tax=Acidithiobacillus thiooxidans TaxID=930 RepID=A0A1C2ISA1_ACITH|nr:hypothetical protein A6P07_15425 [Acidithiobacillus thiooxidans]OCX71729.1 hypothetical protein A6O24_15160 [Acidithiobacillus thiooxidans]OCX78865.1 hypothetical protein A6O26_17515 [Acidithiobacillus thiooxidans]OCX86656.1 hypothetical protein A6M27_12085 [Acidithiobacillus thiooxidans]OFC44925.1 hypothetical protein BAE47_11020 [Acidithiobacillus thiooxidans]